jgi:hypothetical protein
MAEEEAEVTKPNMTPMIDVVFQLIVFFLVSMKFKSLDMRIDAFLPKDRGLAPTPSKPPEVPKIVVVMQHRLGEPVTRLKVANAPIGVLHGTEQVKADPSLKATNKATLDALTKLAADARARAGDAADEVKGEVDAGSLVPTGDVLRAVDAFIAGGLKDVTFIGTPEPGSVMDKVREEAGVR